MGLRILTALAALFLLFLVGYWRIVDPNFWADDGIFFRDFLEHGWASLVLPHDGYYHTWPRLITAIVTSSFPIEFWPIANSILSILVFWIYLLPILSQRLSGILPTPSARALLLILIPFAPGLWEALANTNNLHWVCTFWMGYWSLRNVDSTTPHSLWEFTLLILAVFSSGESIIFLPILAWRLLPLLHKFQPSKLLRSFDFFAFTLICLNALACFIAKESRFGSQFNFSPKIFSSLFHTLSNQILLRSLIGDHLTLYLAQNIDFLWWGLIVFLIAWWIKRSLKDKVALNIVILVACYLALHLLMILAREETMLYFNRMHRQINFSLFRYGFIFEGVSLIVTFYFLLHARVLSQKKWILSVFAIFYLGLSFHRIPLPIRETDYSWSTKLDELTVQCANDAKLLRIPVAPDFKRFEIRGTREKLCP
ncbi:hypothetical protein GW915_07950 [bacterium]|nr:hypothetical protein [bacterium]